MKSDKQLKKRGGHWNYGGKNWKLSRSKIELFHNCPRCFYFDNKLGIRRPTFAPYSLNITVDELLKSEFDLCREKGIQHAIQIEHNLTCVPAIHDQLPEWRQNYKGVQYYDDQRDITITGAIDDLWYDPESESYIVVDYKATGTSDPVTELNGTYHEGYKRQMDIYQWLLRKNGLPISDNAYFLFAQVDKDREVFENALHFNSTLIEYKGDDSWVDVAIHQAIEILQTDTVPDADPECEHCAFCAHVETASKVATAF